MYALYQVSIRQATISLSLLLAHTSRCKPWESLWGSSATTPLVDFHHRLTACPSYQKNLNTAKYGIQVFKLPAAGLEPARGCPQQILSLPRLPFRHAGLYLEPKFILSQMLYNCKCFL